MAASRLTVSSEIESASSKEKASSSALSLGGSDANFLQAGVRDFESNEAWGAQGRLAQAGDDLFALQLIEQQSDNCGRVDDLIGHGLRG